MGLAPIRLAGMLSDRCGDMCGELWDAGQAFDIAGVEEAAAAATAAAVGA